MTLNQLIKPKKMKLMGLLPSHVNLVKKAPLLQLSGTNSLSFCFFFAGILRSIVDILYELDIISSEGFLKWRDSKNPLEQEGKGKKKTTTKKKQQKF